MQTTLPGSTDREKMLKTGAIQKIKREQRSVKLDIQRARNALTFSTSELHEYADLSLYLQDAHAAFAQYEQAVQRYDALRERLQELES